MSLSISMTSLKVPSASARNSIAPPDRILDEILEEKSQILIVPAPRKGFSCRPPAFLHVETSEGIVLMTVIPEIDPDPKPDFSRVTRFMGITDKLLFVATTSRFTTTVTGEAGEVGTTDVCDVYKFIVTIKDPSGQVMGYILSSAKLNQNGEEYRIIEEEASQDTIGRIVETEGQFIIEFYTELTFQFKTMILVAAYNIYTTRRQKHSAFFGGLPRGFLVSVVVAAVLILMLIVKYFLSYI